MGKEVVNRTGGSVDVLEPCTHDSKHGQSAILDLLSSQVLDLLRRTGSPTKGVKPKATRVTHIGSGELVVGKDGVSVDTAWLDYVSPSSTLGPANEKELNYEEGSSVREVFQLSS